MPIIRPFLALAVLAATLTATAQSGLPSRPVNATCVAPPPIAARVALEPVARSATRSGPTGRGREQGVLYRGQRAPRLAGSYVYVSDDGHAIRARLAVGHIVSERTLAISEVALEGLVEARDGELYAISPLGTYALRAAAPEVPAGFPTTLSATGCFDAADPTQPAAGVIPYGVSAPLYSDNATKRRWLAMPDWHTPGTQITIAADGRFVLPPGAILIKEFKLGATFVETRLYVRHLDGVWRGYSYEWNDDQTDAVLLDARKVKDINGQTWTYPSGVECDVCHGAAANWVLGLEIAQLNHDFTYPLTGLTANQLTTLDAIGLIAGSLPGPVATLDALPFYADESAPLDARARGYLHSNCANCHRPGGNGSGAPDLRYHLDGNATNANGVAPLRGDVGVPGALIIKRGVPEESVIPLRMRDETFWRMPILGVSIVDDDGVALIERWIRSGLGFGIPDSDGDEIADDLDTCSAHPNPDQRDTDGDGFGNACDPDLNNDGVVNVLDLGIFKTRFYTTDADADFNGDGIVNVLDLGILKLRFFTAPGPGPVL